MDKHEKYLDSVLNNPDNVGLTVEYYPNIKLMYQNNDVFGGTIMNENISKIKLPYDIVKHTEYTEYTHNEKHLRVYSGETKKREFIHVSQVDNKIIDGLFVLSKYEYIDPNKFPIMNRYYDVKHVKSTSCERKGVEIFLIEEKDTISYSKISFIVPENEQLKKKIKKEFTTVCSSMSQMQ